MGKLKNILQFEYLKTFDQLLEYLPCYDYLKSGQIEIFIKIRIILKTFDHLEYLPCCDNQNHKIICFHELKPFAV